MSGYFSIASLYVQRHLISPETNQFRCVFCRFSFKKRALW